MQRGRPTPAVVLSRAERHVLERWARRRSTASALARRARIVLACAGGRTNAAVAATVEMTRQTVGRWRRRFVTQAARGPV